MFRDLFNFAANKVSIKRIDNFWHTKEMYDVFDSVAKVQPDIFILWNGDIWDKVEQFIKKTKQIHKAGLDSTKKLILWSDNVSQRSSQEDFPSLLSEKIANYYSYAPVLVVRSSWQGDAQWVWIYNSYFTLNDPIAITAAVHKVLESNYTPSAILYREKLWLQKDTMGICIEPCIGSIHDNRYFWPTISGRSKRNDAGCLELWMAAGVWGGVSDRNYYRMAITPEQEARIDDKKVYPEISSMYSRLLADNLFSGQKYNTIFDLNTGTVSDVDLWNVFKSHAASFPILQFIQSIKKLEKKMKAPQYIEFAGNYINENKMYITQIADSIHEDMVVNLKQSWKLLLKSDNPRLSWIKEFDKVVVIDIHSACRGLEQDVIVKSLSKYNESNKDYLLIVSDQLTCGGQELPFTAFSNAWWIIEKQSALWHWSPPASHYEWLLSSVNIFFSTYNNDIGSVFNNMTMKKFWPYGSIKELCDYKFILVQDAKKWISHLFLQE